MNQAQRERFAYKREKQLKKLRKERRTAFSSGGGVDLRFDFGRKRERAVIGHPNFGKPWDIVFRDAEGTSQQRPKTDETHAGAHGYAHFFAHPQRRSPSVGGSSAKLDFFSDQFLREGGYHKARPGRIPKWTARLVGCLGRRACGVWSFRPMDVIHRRNVILCTPMRTTSRSLSLGSRIRRYQLQ